MKKEIRSTKKSFSTKIYLQLVGASLLYIVVGTILLFGDKTTASYNFIRRQLFCNADLKSESAEVLGRINSLINNGVIPVINNIGAIND